MTIRFTCVEDFTTMQAMELEAGWLFAPIGMQSVVDDEP